MHAVIPQPAFGTLLPCRKGEGTGMRVTTALSNAMGQQLHNPLGTTHRMYCDWRCCNSKSRQFVMRPERKLLKRYLPPFGFSQVQAAGKLVNSCCLVLERETLASPENQQRKCYLNGCCSPCPLEEDLDLKYSQTRMFASPFGKLPKVNRGRIKVGNLDD